MKRIVLYLAAAALGLSVPASASAQQRLGDVLGQVLQVQARVRFDDGDNRGHGRGREDDRGNRGRGQDRGPERGPDRGQERGPERGPPVYRGQERGPPVYRGDDRGPPVYQQPPRGYPQARGRPGPYQQPGENWRPAGPTGGEISMSQAIRIVQGMAGPGHHLDGEREERGGRTYYRIQWATDRGERRDYYVDAQTGALIGR